MTPPPLTGATATAYQPASPSIHSPPRCSTSKSPAWSCHTPPIPLDSCLSPLGEHDSHTGSSIPTQTPQPDPSISDAVGLRPSLSRFESFDTWDPCSIKHWPSFRLKPQPGLEGWAFGSHTLPGHAPHFFVSSLECPCCHLHQVKFLSTGLSSSNPIPLVRTLPRPHNLYPWPSTKWGVLPFWPNKALFLYNYAFSSQYFITSYTNICLY